MQRLTFRADGTEYQLRPAGATGAAPAWSYDRARALLRRATPRDADLATFRRYACEIAPGEPSRRDDGDVLAWLAQRIARRQLYLSRSMRHWQRVVAEMELSTPADRAALWNGIGPARAMQLASANGWRTVEMTPGGASLNGGLLKRELDADFGPGWGEEKRQVWLMVSQRFASLMSGHVRALIAEERLAGGVPNRGILVHELLGLDILSPLQANPAVRTVMYYAVRTTGGATTEQLRLHASVSVTADVMPGLQNYH